MKITKALRAWLVKEYDCDVNDSDDDLRKAAVAAMLEGKLTAEKHAELSKEDDEDEANEFAKRFDRIADGLEKAIDLLATKEEEEEETDEKSEDTEVKEVKSSGLAMKIASIGGTVEGNDETVEARVKAAVEQYSTTKTALLYPESTKHGRPHQNSKQRVKAFGEPLDEASDLEKALSGVWAKFQLMSVTPKLAGNAHAAFAQMNNHDKSLLCHLAEEAEWDNSRDYVVGRQKGYNSENGRGIKALIDDATSGGLEAAPIVFDEQVIQVPLLNGELYPMVNEIPLSRGRRIEGVSIETVTGSWGGVDDSAITLFNTNSFVAAFDTTIYRWEGAVRIGLDFLSDTPIDFGAVMTQQYGERLLEDLDDVIATGNGTTQPEGYTNATGTTSVAFSGTTTIGNYESLRFSVPKNEHTAAVKSSAVFIGTETSYSRARGIPVGTADARRVGGMDYDSYSWMQRPYKINESLTNQQIIYTLMKRYRMYRRKGFAVRTSTEGDTLIRNNSMLIVAMARYGGQVERGACVGITTTAPA